MYKFNNGLKRGKVVNFLKKFNILLYHYYILNLIFFCFKKIHFAR